MDVLITDRDEFVVEYLGLIGDPPIHFVTEGGEATAGGKEDGTSTGVRVVVLHEEETDAFLVLWQYVEGNTQDRWKLMWRNDKVSDALKFWSDFVGDLYHDYGRGEYAERDKRLQRAE